MAHSEARAWWADVQHLRDGYERTDEARRRADEADLAARRAIRDRRGIEAEVSSMRSGRHAFSAAPTAAPRSMSGPERTSRAASQASSARMSGPERTSRPASEPISRHAHELTSRAARERAREPELTGPPSGGHVDAASQPRMKGGGTPGRRTVEIRGRTVPAPMPPRHPGTDRHRPPRRAVQHVGGRPDRVAMWALLMCLLLILVAIGTADNPAVVALALR